MKHEPVNRWIIFCEICSHKQIINSSDPASSKLVEIKTSPIPGGAPGFDTEKKQIQNRPSQQQNKKFKCPKCGRGVVAKKLPEVYVGAYKDIDDQRRKQHEEEEKKKRIQDGTPIRRNDANTEFLG